MSKPSETSASFTAIPEAIEALKNGEFLVVMDDENRENEGDLIIAAEHVTQEKMAFLVRHSSGYVCVPMSTERAEKLDLQPMLKNQTDRHGTAYTVTCDYADGTTTGISAHDRALTARKLADPTSTASGFIKPGHILPLRAVDGLLRKRRGHTEASVELCRLSGLEPVAVICELVRDDDGLMMRLDDCVGFAKKFGIKVVTIEQIVKHLN
jgi:3,4-dihydroxy 2-butanone 4-phosphate synthase